MDLSPFPSSVLVGREHPPVELGALPLFASRVREVVLDNDGAEVLAVRCPVPGAAFKISPANGSAGDEDWTIAPGTSKVLAFTAAEVGNHETVVVMMATRTCVWCN